MIRAAGCVLWRRAPADGGLELALVHRPKWEDWSHPKGKLKPGESAREAALREVLEETGMSCALGPPLPTARYEVRAGRKEVSYWAAEAADGTFAPNDEVDALLWLPPAPARTRLSHDRDRALVTSLLDALSLPRPQR
ncbi:MULTISPECIES: NUDIX hydrolase [unclassified Streptomyces]|uniref:NUDIX hydrolase n=1 Tax=unclassified Streptomyces TaxID=2593676 RepID=UPI002DDB40FA|nr:MULTISPECIES: NUDIX hydrolase [unclassified Streptomyces]WSA93897.1 NUDIX hydrolase [Streptomyces sp. NBC_01795]WSB78267.1 NUDIX hydrolase [Streptomyces sp. NBC_01775]WSS13476.1 NUDIX hydrolase [Streptomyces sp. NBC_01186]WSS42274.1 NUDIX hydrolase [Streptomyces sp. NBC_01187]